MINRVSATLVAIVSMSAAANGQTPSSSQLVAVLELNNKLSPADRQLVDAAYLANVLRGAALKAVPGARVMTRENVTTLLSSGQALADCEGECEVDTGRRLGADLLVTGDLLRFGSKLKLDLRLYATFEARLIAVAQASGATPDELEVSAQQAAQDLFKRDVPPTTVTVVPAAPAPMPSQSSDVPPLRDDLLSPNTEASPDALVALQAALITDRGGSKAPVEAATAWGKVANAAVPNSYVRAAQERQGVWVRVIESRKALADRAAAAFKRMVKLLASPDLSFETKQKLIAGFIGQYGADALEQERSKLDDTSRALSFGETLVRAKDGWIDTAARLLWQPQPSAFTMTQDEAIQLCRQAGWRLPLPEEVTIALTSQRKAGLPMPMDPGAGCLGRSGRHGFARLDDCSIHR